MCPNINCRIGSLPGGGVITHISVYQLSAVLQVTDGIKPTLLELEKFEAAPEDVELESILLHEKC